jgi:hypothetical protein
MASDSDFQFASERLELSVSTVAGLAEGCPLDSAFALLYVLQFDRERHSRILYDSLDKLAVVSDSPIKWEHGRGQSGLVRHPNAVYPHRWSSAHEAALAISRLALAYFYWPLELPAEAHPEFKKLSVDQQPLFRKLLGKNRRKALAMTMEEVADWQERIRRERAKLLTTPSNGAEQAATEAIWLGNDVVRIGDKPVSLEFQESTVLEALIGLGGAAKRPDLEKKALVKDVAEIMKKLKDRFPEHIVLPGRRGRGGYTTTIKDGTKAAN